MKKEDGGPKLTNKYISYCHGNVLRQFASKQFHFSAGCIPPSYTVGLCSIAVVLRRVWHVLSPFSSIH